MAPHFDFKEINKCRSGKRVFVFQSAVYRLLIPSPSLSISLFERPWNIGRESFITEAAARPGVFWKPSKSCLFMQYVLLGRVCARHYEYYKRKTNSHRRHMVPLGGALPPFEQGNLMRSYVSLAGLTSTERTRYLIDFKPVQIDNITFHHSKPLFLPNGVFRMRIIRLFQKFCPFLWVCFKV